MSLLKENECETKTIFKSQSIYHDFGSFGSLNLTHIPETCTWDGAGAEKGALTELNAHYTRPHYSYSKAPQDQMQSDPEFQKCPSVIGLLHSAWLDNLKLQKTSTSTNSTVKTKSVVSSQKAVSSGKCKWWNLSKLFIQNVIAPQDF